MGVMAFGACQFRLQTRAHVFDMLCAAAWTSYYTVQSSIVWNMPSMESNTPSSALEQGVLQYNSLHLSWPVVLLYLVILLPFHLSTAGGKL